MIIETIMTCIKNVLNILLVLEIPNLPAQVFDYVNTLFDYMVAGASILANYTPLSYLLVLFGVLLAVDTGLMLYKFVMWIIRKIPVASIS